MRDRIRLDVPFVTIHMKYQTLLKGTSSAAGVARCLTRNASAKCSHSGILYVDLTHPEKAQDSSTAKIIQPENLRIYKTLLGFSFSSLIK